MYDYWNFNGWDLKNSMKIVEKSANPWMFDFICKSLQNLISDFIIITQKQPKTNNNTTEFTFISRLSL